MAEGLKGSRTPPGLQRAGVSVSWAARLAEYRASTFVGREAELELFRQTLQGGQPPFQALAISGGPGSGKTTLLRRFAAECEQSGIEYRLLDAGRIQPVPNAVLRALRSALELAEDTSLASA